MAMGEARFGNPEGLLRLGSALDQTYQGLWALRNTLDAQVTGVVPSAWDGQVAAQFQANWNARSNEIYDAAQFARRTGVALTKLGTELRSAQAMFIQARTIATGSGVWIQDVGVSGFEVLPWGDERTYVPQGLVNDAWLMAGNAWAEAGTVLLAGQLPTWWMKMAGVAVARAPFALTGMALHPVETAKAIGNLLWTVTDFMGSQSPEMYQMDPAYAQQRLDQATKTFNDTIQKIKNDPTAAAEVVIEAAVPVGPAIAGKVGRLLKTGEKVVVVDAATAAAAAQARIQAAEAALSKLPPGKGIPQQGAIGEAANLTLKAQAGETAQDLNKLPSLGNNPINMPGVDNASSSAFTQVKTRVGSGRVQTYMTDLRKMATDSDGKMGKAADAFVDERNQAAIQQLRDQGAWPKELGPGTTREQYLDHLQGNSELAVTDESVPAVRDAVRQNAQNFPENWNLPANPTSEEIDALVNRVKPSGITSTDAQNLLNANTSRPPAIPMAPAPAPAPPAPAAPDSIIRGTSDPIPNSVGDAMPSPPSDNQVAVIGSGATGDTAVAKGFPGHDVLDIQNWTPTKNDAWVLSHADQGHPFYMGTPLNDNSVWDAANNRPRVYGRELGQTFDLGYSQGGPDGTVAGDTLVPPVSARPANPPLPVGTPDPPLPVAVPPIID
jgi:hypothetical protein